jgi:hypothetical protein
LSLFSSEAFAQKVRETVVYSPPTLNVVAEPTLVTVCEGQAEVVHLNARAVSPGGHPIRYSWRANAGRIQGDGANVIWDLAGAQPGYYKAYVDIDTGSGDELCQAFSSAAVRVNRCPPPVPVCPTVRISCPDNPVLGQPLDFTGTVSGGSPNIAPIYNWTVSAGTIISGQGTNSIRVDTTGLAGQSVRASLSMGGYPMDCSDTCVVQFPVPPVECRKFDEFPDIARNDEKARLDNYAIELQNDPTSTAYVIVYPGQRGRPTDVQKHTARVVDYLINSRGIDGRRIVTLVGPTRPELMVELWTCPQGGRPPTPRP